MNRFETKGAHYTLDGVAKTRGVKNRCNLKLCFYTYRIQPLLDLMYNLSKDNDCFEVKIGREHRGNIFFGECFYTNESALGDIWAKYSLHPNFHLALVDQQQLEPYRSKVRNYTYMREKNST